MVRAKGSDQNKAIATYFASTVTVAVSSLETRKHKDLNGTVACSGKRGIYEVLMACLPSIVRSPRDSCSENRKGLTEIEFFKSLVRCGYVPLRRRALSEKIAVKKAHWHKEWKGRRWVDLTNCEDILYVERRLSYLQELPDARMISLNSVKDAIVAILSQPSTPTLKWNEVQNSYPSSSTPINELKGKRISSRTAFDGNRLKMSPVASSITSKSQAEHIQPLPFLAIENGIVKVNKALFENLEGRKPPRPVREGRADAPPSIISESEPWLAQQQRAAADGQLPMFARHYAGTLPADDAGPESISPAPQACRARAPPNRPAAPLRRHAPLRRQAPPHRMPARDGLALIKAEAATEPPVPAPPSAPPACPLLRLAAQHDWAESAEMRRLCTFGHGLSPVLQLLTALPPRLLAVLASYPPEGPGAATAAGAAAGIPGAAGAPGTNGCTAAGGRGGGGWDEARAVFCDAEERARRVMEEDELAGYLEADFDPGTQRRSNVFLTTRYAALRGTSRPALLAAFAAHAVPLPAAAADFLAAALHAAALRRRGEADCTQYLRVAGPAGLPALVREDSRTRFDAAGRVVRVRRRRRRLPRSRRCRGSCPAPAEGRGRGGESWRGGMSEERRGKMGQLERGQRRTGRRPCAAFGGSRSRPPRRVVAAHASARMRTRGERTSSFRASGGSAPRGPCARPRDGAR
jgi:hypothetical protein